MRAVALAGAGLVASQRWWTLVCVQARHVMRWQRLQHAWRRCEVETASGSRVSRRRVMGLAVLSVCAHRSSGVR